MLMGAEVSEGKSHIYETDMGPLGGRDRGGAKN